MHGRGLDGLGGCSLVAAVEQPLDLTGCGVGKLGDGVRSATGGTAHGGDIAQNAIDLDQIGRQRLHGDGCLLEQRLDLGNCGLKLIDDAVELGYDRTSLLDSAVDLLHRLVERSHDVAGATQGKRELRDGPNADQGEHDKDDLHRFHGCLHCKRATHVRLMIPHKDRAQTRSKP